MPLTPREYTLHRVILLGLDIKSKHGKDDYRVKALRELYLALKQDAGDPTPHFMEVRRIFLGLDLINFDRILTDEARINSLSVNNHN